MLVCDYEVVGVDGDYAHLRRIWEEEREAGEEQETKLGVNSKIF